MKYVDVKIQIGLDGKYEAEIVGRGDGTSCLSENDARLVRDVVNGDAFGEVEDFAHTKEYWEEMQPNQEHEEETLFKDLPVPQKGKNRDIDKLT